MAFRREAREAAREPDPARYVPVEAVRELLRDRADHMARRSEAEAEARVTAAMDRGYPTPAVRPWAVALCRQDPIAFDGFLATAAPAYAHLSSLTPFPPQPGAPGGRRAAASDDEAALCRQLGIDRIRDQEPRGVRAELEPARAELAAAAAALSRAEAALAAALEKADVPLDLPAPTAPVPEHRRLHRTGRPARLDADPELRAFVAARLDRHTFVEVAALVAEPFPPARRVGKSAIHAWSLRSRGGRSGMRAGPPGWSGRTG